MTECRERSKFAIFGHYSRKIPPMGIFQLK
jgi:hypothetical protein